MQVRHLELLRELALRGSLAAVAEATHRTPSALSQQLRTAERELGVALTEPSPRGLRLSAQGQILADGADEVLRSIADLQARLDASAGEPSGLVSIGTLPSAGEALMPPLFEALRDSTIRIDVDDFDLTEADFAARTLDADIVIGHSMLSDVPAGAEALVTQVIAHEPVGVAVPSGHPLATLLQVDPEDLRGTNWIGVPAGYPFDAILQSIEARLEEPLPRDLRMRDNRLVESLVRAGAGLALLPRFTTRPSSDLVMLPLVGVPAQRRVVAMCRPDRHERVAVRTVLDELARIGAALMDD